MSATNAANVETGAETRAVTPGTQQVEVAVLAGGCFWGVEDILRDVPGVIDTEVGYTGGWLENPKYDDTHHSKSGHAEAVAYYLRSFGAQFRGAAGALVFPITRPNHTQPAGQRHRHAVSLSDFSADGGTASNRGTRHRACRCIREMEAADHHEHRASRDMVRRRRLPPGLSAQESRRVHLPLHARLRN